MAIVARLILMANKERPDISFMVVESRKKFADALRALKKPGGEVGSAFQNQTFKNIALRDATFNVSEIYATTKVLVAPSLWYESWGRVTTEAGVAQADASVLAAQAELRRGHQLVAQGFISASRLDELQRAVDVALAQQRNANAQRQANADTGTDLAQAQAQLAVARASTQAAAARLAQATVRAPTDATVLLRTVEPGQIVQPGKALLQLALAGPTQLVAQLDERFLEQLEVGQRATVIADAFPNQRLQARVLSMAPGVDAQRGSIEVKLALQAAPPAFLREDMTLSVEIETGRRPQALALLQSGDELRFELVSSRKKKWPFVEVVGVFMEI